MLDLNGVRLVRGEETEGGAAACMEKIPPPSLLFFSFLDLANVGKNRDEEFHLSDA